MKPKGGRHLDHRLEQAMQLHQAGEFARAEPLYGAVLAERPNDATALHYMGLLRHHTGRPADAAEMIRRSIAANPGGSEAHANLGMVLRALGDTDEAIACYRQAIRLDPQSVTAHFNLGNVLYHLGRLDEAAAAYREAARLAPSLPEAHFNLGESLFGLKRLDEAAGAYADAVRLAPDRADFLCHLGGTLRQLDRLDEAAACYSQAIQRNPASAVAFNGLGNVYYDRRELDVAISCHQRAIALDADNGLAHSDLGCAYFDLGDQAGAIACFRRATALAPDYPDAHYHLAVALLRQGDCVEGFAEYEWRRKKKDFPGQDYAVPEWRGESLDGKTILLYAEQGLGDAIQFARFASALAAKGARVLLAAYAPLLRLARSVPGVAAVVGEGDVVAGCHFQLPMMSAPHVLGTVIATIPAEIPYLSADVAAARAWRDRLAAEPGFKVGLVWSGDPRSHDRGCSLVDRRRSLRLAQFAPLAGIAGITLVNLQKGRPAAELATAPAGLRIVDYMDEIGDFAGTAALVANLDLVISVDTSVAHLAGAMGKPVWILSRFDGCWRWLLDRDDSPWYPTARLFRQRAPGDWDEVVARVAAQLRLTA